MKCLKMGTDYSSVKVMQMPFNDRKHGKNVEFILSERRLNKTLGTQSNSETLTVCLNVTLTDLRRSVLGVSPVNVSSLCARSSKAAAKDVPPVLGVFAKTYQRFGEIIMPPTWSIKIHLSLRKPLLSDI